MSRLLAEKNEFNKGQCLTLTNEMKEIVDKQTNKTGYFGNR